MIETFIDNLNEVDDVQLEWQNFVSEEREKTLGQIIQDEKLKEPETRRFMESAFRDGEVKTVGTDIDKLMPLVSRFGNSNRPQIKQKIIDKLSAFFETFFGLGNDFKAE